jgi:hypothetical protein
MNRRAFFRSASAFVAALFAPKPPRLQYDAWYYVEVSVSDGIMQRIRVSPVERAPASACRIEL